MTYRLQTSRGRLTAYALACGHVESKEYGQTHITLWSEHGQFHVRAHDRGAGRRFWLSFHTLAEARRHFDYAEALLVAGLSTSKELAA